MSLVETPFLELAGERQKSESRVTFIDTAFGYHPSEILGA
jgi:hypothetical protein